MTWHSAIPSNFRSGLLALLAGCVCLAATVDGTIEIRSANGRRVKDSSNVVVWLEPLDVGVSPPPLHARMLQQHKSFDPHLLVVNVGSTVDFPNLDPIFHNAFSSFDGQIFDIGLYAPGKSRAVQFKRPGIVRVFCNIHPSMSAVIVVLDTPYWAISRANGEYVVRNVPAGAYRLNVFEEQTTGEELTAAGKTILVKEEDLREPTIELTRSNYLPLEHKNKYGLEYPRQKSDYGLPQ